MDIVRQSASASAQELRSHPWWGDWERESEQLRSDCEDFSRYCQLRTHWPQTLNRLREQAGITASKKLWRKQETNSYQQEQEQKRALARESPANLEAALAWAKGRHGYAAAVKDLEQALEEQTGTRPTL